MAAAISCIVAPSMCWLSRFKRMTWGLACSLRISCISSSRVSRLKPCSCSRPCWNFPFFQLQLHSPKSMWSGRGRAGSSTSCKCCAKDMGGVGGGGEVTLPKHCAGEWTVAHQRFLSEMHSPMPIKQQQRRHIKDKSSRKPARSGGGAWPVDLS